MSYFMILAGELPVKDLADLEIEVFPAIEAQDYVVKLIPKLEKTDGTPIWFVHDGKTFTSDMLILDLKNALWMEGSYQKQPIFKLLVHCFENNWNFRIWLANNGPTDFEENSEPVSLLKEALDALRERTGACYIAKNKSLFPQTR